MKINSSSKFLVMIFLLLFIFITNFSVMLIAPIRSDKFSEIWLLSSDNLTNYHFKISKGENQMIILGVGNHMHSSESYLIYLKISNNTENLPDLESSTPSTLDVVNEFSFSLDNNELWEENVYFSFNQFFIQDKVLTIKNISFNNVSSTIDFTTSLNSEKSCFDVFLFFELWRYNITTEKFEFDNSFVGIWLYLRDVN